MTISKKLLTVILILLPAIANAQRKEAPAKYWGINYDYSKVIPFGISVNYINSFFYIGAEAGVLDISEQYQLKNSDNVVKPDFSVFLKPGLFFKYFSVDCGLGALQQSRKVKEERKYFYIDRGGKLVEKHFDVDTKTSTAAFICRPEVKGYIPVKILDRDCLVSIGAGYNIVPEIPKLNGIDLSIGIHFRLGDN